MYFWVTGVTTSCRPPKHRHFVRSKMRVAITFRFSRFLHFFSTTVTIDLKDSGTSRPELFSDLTAGMVVAASDGMASTSTNRFNRYTLTILCHCWLFLLDALGLHQCSSKEHQCSSEEHQCRTEHLLLENSRKIRSSTGAALGEFCWACSALRVFHLGYVLANLFSSTELGWQNASQSGEPVLVELNGFAKMHPWSNSISNHLLDLQSIKLEIRVINYAKYQ